MEDFAKNVAAAFVGTVAAILTTTAVTGWVAKRKMKKLFAEVAEK